MYIISHLFCLFVKSLSIQPHSYIRLRARLVGGNDFEGMRMRLGMGVGVDFGYDSIFKIKFGMREYFEGLVKLIFFKISYKL